MEEVRRLEVAHTDSLVCMYVYVCVRLYVIAYIHINGGPGDPSLFPAQCLWDFWWMNWHCDRFYVQQLRFFLVSIIPSTFMLILLHVSPTPYFLGN